MLTVYWLQLPDLSLDVLSESLRKQLALSTADLRFADYLVKNVCDERFDGEDQDLYGESGKKKRVKLKDLPCFRLLKPSN